MIIFVSIQFFFHINEGLLFKKFNSKIGENIPTIKRFQTWVQLQRYHDNINTSTHGNLSILLLTYILTI